MRQTRRYIPISYQYPRRFQEGVRDDERTLPEDKDLAKAIVQAGKVFDKLKWGFIEGDQARIIKLFHKAGVKRMEREYPKLYKAMRTIVDGIYDGGAALAEMGAYDDWKP